MSIALPPEPHYSDSTISLHHGDCLDVLRSLPDASVDAVVTDPPYGLEFMGKEWDRPDRMGKVSAPGMADGSPMRRNTGTPSWGASGNPGCRKCNGQRYGNNPDRQCRCETPDFPNHMAVQMRAFQGWCEQWARECLRVLKPGGHILAFGGTRTWHRLTCAVEDAGFEIRDSIAWLYGSGFPKSLDVSKAIDKAAGAEREVTGSRPTGAGRTGYLSAADQTTSGYRPPGREFVPANEVAVTAPASLDAERWQGWGTALKPAFEPVVVARKPLVGTVAANVLAHGTGALNIAGCRIAGESTVRQNTAEMGYHGGNLAESYTTGSPAGRWPANVILDESQAAALNEQSGELTSGANPTRRGSDKFRDAYGEFAGQEECVAHRGADSGGASRFFYIAKAPTDERVRVNGVAHPTVKPLSLMRWLVRLVTPPGGTVLEPFAGSGTTVEACLLEGFRCIAIEREAEYLPLIRQRINRRRDPVEAVKTAGEDGGLFDLLGEESA